MSTTNKINEAGVTYYKNLLKELKDNEIIPMVTLYHWDLPQPLQDAGGWPDEFIINRFVDYARVCFQLFGDDVKYWATFNEAKQTCLQGYSYGSFAPGIQHPGVDDYLCAHNVIRAHARVWHIYDQEFRPTQNGNICDSFFVNLYFIIFL
ncbi:hypothetical protein NQ314_012213 [Rhamnusium bicolor]|uniref:Uncharacterized protein n=1 Tax=Rhamnusium bicolor TaxID=1586634 RepID=A0AAV8XDQ8_9CUCU|nr:hypothetical protein NQ314_012213 [Rhamnusium bicolor]